MCFQIPEKGVRSQVFLRFKYLGEKLPLTKKLRCESFLTMFDTINSSPLAQDQVSFYNNIYLLLPNVSSTFKATQVDTIS